MISVKGILDLYKPLDSWLTKPIRSSERIVGRIVPDGRPVAFEISAGLQGALEKAK